MRYSVNTRCLFPGASFEEALILLKKHGYGLVEDWTLVRDELPERARLLTEMGMGFSTFCPAYFVLNDVAYHDEYEKSLRAAIEDAKTLNCPSIITQVGNDTKAPRTRQHEAIITGVKRMAPLLEAADVTLLVEPLNDVKDHIGYYLTDSNEGFEIIREVNSPNVRLLYDVYHQVHMGEDVLRRIEPNFDLIGHFHIAGHPNRDEKLFGEFDYAPVLNLIRESGTSAPVGLELFASSREAAEAILDELAAYL